MATNEEARQWFTESFDPSSGYSADNYMSRISNLQDRYIEGGVTDAQMREIQGRNEYDDWVTNIQSGATAFSTGWDTDMEAFDWNLGGDIPAYNQATEYEDWSDEELLTFWGELKDDYVTPIRDESMDWLSGGTNIVSPDDINETYLTAYKTKNPDSYQEMHDDFLATPGSDSFTQEQSNVWASDWLNLNNAANLYDYEGYDVKPGEVGLLSDRLNTILDTGQGQYYDSTGQLTNGNDLSEIEKLYQDYAGRTADAGGAAYWASTGLTGAELEAEFSKAVQGSSVENRQAVVDSGESIITNQSLFDNPNYVGAGGAGVSSYIERARTQALEQAGSRGLLNSSMAAGAAEGAAIDRGLQVAQGDVDVDKFNVGADTAAQQARYNAAAAFAASSQNAQQAMLADASEMTAQMLLNKQAHGQALTVKEQDHLNSLQILSEQQKDLLEGKAIDFDNETALEAQKNYYDVLGKEIDYQLQLISDEALYEHQAMLQGMQEGTTLYTGYMTVMSAALASNLDKDAKTDLVASINLMYQTALTSVTAYKGIEFPTDDPINWEDYYGDYKPKGVDGTIEDVEDIPPVVDNPNPITLPTPGEEEELDPFWVAPYTVPEQTDHITGEYLIAFETDKPEEYATMMEAWGVATGDDVDLYDWKNPANSGVMQKWLMSYLVSGATSLSPYLDDLIPIEETEDEGSGIPTFAPLYPVFGDTFKPGDVVLTWNGNGSWIDDYNNPYDSLGNPLDENGTPLPEEEEEEPTVAPTNPQVNDTFTPSSSAGMLTWDGSNWINISGVIVDETGLAIPQDEEDTKDYYDSSGNVVQSNTLSESAVIFQDLTGRTIDSEGEEYWESTGLTGQALEEALSNAVSSSSMNAQDAQALVDSGDIYITNQELFDSTYIYEDLPYYEGSKYLTSQVEQWTVDYPEEMGYIGSELEDNDILLKSRTPAEKDDIMDLYVSVYGLDGSTPPADTDAAGYEQTIQFTSDDSFYSVYRPSKEVTKEIKDEIYNSMNVTEQDKFDEIFNAVSSGYLDLMGVELAEGSPAYSYFVLKTELVVDGMNLKEPEAVSKYTTDDVAQWEINNEEGFANVANELYYYTEALEPLSIPTRDKISTVYVSLYGLDGSIPPEYDNDAGSSVRIKDEDDNIVYIVYKAASDVTVEIYVDLYSSFNLEQQTAMDVRIDELIAEYRAWTSTELEVGSQAMSWIILEGAEVAKALV